MNRRQRKKLKKKQMERLMMVDVEKVIALLRDPDTMKVLEQALQKIVEAVQKITNTMLRVLEEKNFRSAVIEGAHAAAERSREMQKKAQKEFQKFVFDLENARKEEVQKFNHELKSGWWFSNKVGWFLYMSNLITLIGAFLYCYYK